MEIPTEEIIEQLEILLPHHRQDAIKLIKDQAREILDLQATICRLKDEFRISSDLRELDKRDGE